MLAVFLSTFLNSRSFLLPCSANKTMNHKPNFISFLLTCCVSESFTICLTFDTTFSCCHFQMRVTTSGVYLGKYCEVRQWSKRFYSALNLIYITMYYGFQMYQIIYYLNVLYFVFYKLLNHAHF